ncbi:MAG: hypothetical protein HN981_02115 [Candidatus Pacebacteria bacterium]|nr:hypothetical protein [Candidatus Paceibacterota bacterium]MBT6921167.1 hypothetical protein [Candidatus Paceibacterota bacterium]
MNKTTARPIPSSYERKLNGHRCSHRNRWKLIATGKLTIQSLSLLEFYIDVSDFDKKHYSFGTFKANFQSISRVFNCSTNTVRNWHKQLVKAGFITKTEEREIYRLKCPERYILPGFWQGKASAYTKAEKNQSAEEIFQLMRTNYQKIEEKTNSIGERREKDLRNDDPIALGSSKVEYKVVKQDRLTDKDKRWLEETLS